MLRMKTRAQFQAVLAGTTVARTSHFALHRRVIDPADSSRPSEPGRHPAPLFDGEGPWLGAMVPKRWARRAVTRNAIKRQIYQVSAGAELGAQQAAFLVRLRAAFDKARFPSASSPALKLAVREELQRLFERAK
ncbi:ribonuclease P protein component [Variovorax dokdonensis]|uniref:Ribonuclease P protein component n=1 Tax=Variovorax dokdonensis TaxID=344883 RepID=A0ABT7N9E4_9BURK|nr:ribonuclease P protein component [Variovorax dokdonensis]MDM0044547.1 ribonuclease P protein component [Variovorax dokdonensis]